MTDTSRRLDLARIEARRRRHEAVEPAHFAFVVLHESSVAEVLRQRGIDPTELRERLEGALAARTVVGGYRDGSDAPLSPALERVVDRLGRRRWLPFGKSLGLDESLLLEPSIAALAFELRRGNDYRHIIERARALAVVRRHGVVSVEHAFRALLDLRSFVDALQRAEGDLDRVRAVVAQRLDAVESHVEPRAPALDQPMTAVVEGAHFMARSYGPAPPTIRQFCLQLAIAGECAPLWEAAGTDASAFARAVHLPDSNRGASLFR